PVVVHQRGTRDVEEREVEAREQEHDEAVEGDLAEHERPLVGKHLVQRLAREPRRTEAVVEPASDALHDHGDGSIERSQVANTTHAAMTSAAPPNAHITTPAS